MNETNHRLGTGLAILILAFLVYIAVIVSTKPVNKDGPKIPDVNPFVVPKKPDPEPEPDWILVPLPGGRKRVDPVH